MYMSQCGRFLYRVPGNGRSRFQSCSELLRVAWTHAHTKDLDHLSGIFSGCKCVYIGELKTVRALVIVAWQPRSLQYSLYIYILYMHIYPHFEKSLSKERGED